MGDSWVKFQEYKKLKSGVLHIALEAYFIALSKLPYPWLSVQIVFCYWGLTEDELRSES